MIPHSRIQSILKQKPPFIFVDKVIEHEIGKRIVAIKNVTGNEFFSAFHFPNNPIYPGIFIIEAIAQTTALLCAMNAEEGRKNNNNNFMALGGVQHFRFLKPAKPGDTLIIEVEAVKLTEGMAVVKSSVRIEGELTAEGQLTFGTALGEASER